MPPDTNADVLRRHGLHVLADWAENILIAPAYVRQSQYWASVLSPPVIPDFAEWDMNDARGFEFEPELPFGDVPAVFPFVPAVFADIPALLCVHKHKFSAPPACLPTRANTEMRPNEPALWGDTGVCFVFRV